ncbi:MAG: sigma-70 family RNA polymerase sigma factor [Bacteroidales bacterium]|nr:sigma-70 family RNA polymerase sigma factor [Bacteroidales bacterium]
MDDLSDSALLKAFREPATRNWAFGQILRKYQERIYWHIRKIVVAHADADDAIQNTFMSVWLGLDAFREGSSLYTWIYRIATNEALALLRRRSKQRYEVPLDTPDLHLLHQLAADPHIDGTEAQLKLQRVIMCLPEKQRLVFNMRYFDELKYEDISEILGTSVGALKASYHHAVKKIEQLMAQD